MSVVRRLASGLRARSAPPVPARHADLDGGHVLTVATALDDPEPVLLTADGVPVPVDDEPPPGTLTRPEVRVTCWSLAPLLFEPAGTTLRLVARDGRHERPVQWERPPLTTPVASTAAERRLTLAAAPDGSLVVRVTESPPSALLLGVAPDDGAARLDVRLPAIPHADVRVVLELGGTVAATIPAIVTADLASCVLSGADLPHPPGRYDVSVATGADHLAVVRRDNGLVDASTVLLPWVLDEDERVAARLVFAADGRLQLDRRPAEEVDGA